MPTLGNENAGDFVYVELRYTNFSSKKLEFSDIQGLEVSSQLLNSQWGKTDIDPESCSSPIISCRGRKT